MCFAVRCAEIECFCAGREIYLALSFALGLAIRIACSFALGVALRFAFRVALRFALSSALCRNSVSVPNSNERKNAF